MTNISVKRRLLAAVIAAVVAMTGNMSLIWAETEAADEVNTEKPVTQNFAVADAEEDTSVDITEEEGSDDTAEDVPEINANNITEIEELDVSVAKQTITAYSGKQPQLPSALPVKTEGTEETVNVDVKWTCDKTYSSKKAGTYNYSCVIPQEYTLSEGVTLPEITVVVKKCTTKIVGAETSRTPKARYTMYDTVTVYNGYGSVLKIQMYSDGEWLTKKQITLQDAAKEQIKVEFPNNWWKVTSSKWRMKIEGNAGKTEATTATCTVKTRRYYQNPSKYVQIQDKIVIDNSGAYTLKYGYMGLKVRQVNRYFGIGSRYWPRYTSTTKSKVKSFQRRKGLKVTGNVNKATWLKMGYSASSWQNMGAYVSPIKVNPSSTRKQHVEAMIDRAYDYLGSDYVVGASGKPSQGADCSGLVMQALYAAGVEIKGINPVTHSWAGHEYESRNMWKKANFKKISYSKKRRGDLIFYKGSSGAVNHVAIYLGNGKVIESWPNKVRVAKVKHHPIKGVMRVFN